MPSSPQATAAAAWLNESAETVPQMPSCHASSTPAYGLVPSPTRRTACSGSGSAAAAAGGRLQVAGRRAGGGGRGRTSVPAGGQADLGGQAGVHQQPGQSGSSTGGGMLRRGPHLSSRPPSAGSRLTPGPFQPRTCGMGWRRSSRPPSVAEQGPCLRSAPPARQRSMASGGLHPAALATRSAAKMRRSLDG